ADGSYAPYACPDTNLWERLFPPSAPVDFGWVKTAEAFRLVSEPGRPDRKTLLPSGLPAAVPVATGCPEVVVERARGPGGRAREGGGVGLCTAETTNA
ncbi:MAG: hypothetical protein Q4D70_01445, partial [bacterium]|nr:hypothetical protein [bacterium]